MTQDIYSFRAECYIAQKKYSEATDDIIRALSISGNRKAHYLLVTIDKEALPVVKAKFQVQANKNPNEAEWYYYLGQVFEANNKPTEAIAYYEQAHNRDANAIFMERTANCYFDMDNYEYALDYVHRPSSIF